VDSLAKVVIGEEAVRGGWGGGFDTPGFAGLLNHRGVERPSYR